MESKKLKILSWMFFLCLIIFLAVTTFALTVTVTTRAQWNAGTFTNTSTNSSGALILANSTGGQGYNNVDRYGNWTSKVHNLNSTSIFKNITWLPSFGEIPNPFDEPSASLRDPNLVLLLHLNNDSAYGENDTRFFDFSGLGNNGSCDMLNSRCPILNESGKLGKAFTFNGSNNITILQSSTINGTENLTFAFWINWHV